MNRQLFLPFMTQRHVALKQEEVVKIFNSIDHDRCVPELPQNITGGDVFALKLVSKDSSETWKDDGHKWKIGGTLHLPRTRKPVLCKRWYTEVLSDGGLKADNKKEVYTREVGEEEDNVCIVHYLGHYGGDGMEESQTCDQVSRDSVKGEADENSMPDQDVNIPAETSTCEPAAGEPSTSIPSVGSEPDLEAAVRTVKAALQAKSKAAPVIDVFNKLLETVVSNKDEDLDYCLVVSNKKSGQSSVIGTPEAKKSVGSSSNIVTPRPSGRKRGRPRKHVAVPEESEVQKTPAAKKRREASPDTVLTATTVVTSSGTTMKFPQPTKEVFFGYSIITDEEKNINTDFFGGKVPATNKTKYLKIRNHMTECWSSQKPQYFSITQALQGLNDIGEEAAIRRIHAYLECKGVINFNAVKGDSYSSSREPCDNPTKKSEENNASSDEGKESELSSAENRRSKRNAKIVSEKVNDKKEEMPRTNKKSELKARKSATPYASPEKTNDSKLLRPTSRRTRNVATPNWAEVLSGKRIFNKEDKSFSVSPTKSLKDSKSAKQTPKTGKHKKPEQKEAEKGEDTKKEGITSKNQVAEAVGLLQKVKAGSRKDDACLEYEEDKSDNKAYLAIENVTEVLANESVSTEIPNATENEKKTVKSAEDTTNLSENDASTANNIVKTKDKQMFKKSKDVNIDDSVEELEWTGLNSVFRVRAKGNRHMPYKLKIVEENTENTGRSTRSKVAYVCSYCDKKFSVKYLLEEHVKTHSKSDQKEDVNNMPDLLEEDQISDGDNNDNDVDFNQELANEEDVDFVQGLDDKKKIGKKGKKQRSEGKIFKLKGTDVKPTCQECGSVFLTEANLRRHSLLHTNKMYECPFCAKVMKRKDYVLSHIRKIHKEVDLEANPVDFTDYTHTLSDSGTIDKTGGTNDAVEDNTESKTLNDQSGIQLGVGKNVCPVCSKVMDTPEDLEQHVLIAHEKDIKDVMYTCHACKKKFKTFVSFEVHKMSHRMKDHDCPHCGKVFPTNAQLQVHKRHDHNIQYGTLMYFGFLINDSCITCEICSTKFDTMADYHQHRPSHLTLEHMCTVCGNGFTKEEELHKHIDSKCSYQNLHLACGVCDLRFSMYDTRRKHIQSAHVKKTDFYCHHCGISFDDMETLTKHFPIHKAEKIFECDFCEKHFFEKRNLVDHRDLHKASKNFKCHLCDRFYISSKSLQRHIKLHLCQDKHRCKHCGKIFPNKEELQQHVEDKHGEEAQEPDGSTSEHVCNICFKGFTLKSRLVKHMQIHSDKERQFQYKCNYCDQYFDMVNMPLWRHLRAEHPDEVKKKKKDFICETCGFTTIHKQRLQRHLETHNSEKIFSCEVCLRKFQTTSSLLTHMIVHRGKIKKGARENSACSWPNCGKVFIKYSYLKKHLLSHLFRVKNGKDPCDCKACLRNIEDNSNFMYFADNAEEDESVLDKTQDGLTSASGGTVNLVLTSGGQIQGYESMDVLQEAIAQIEDIEKNADEGNKNNITTTENEEASGEEINSTTDTFMAPETNVYINEDISKSDEQLGSTVSTQESVTTSLAEGSYIEQPECKTGEDADESQKKIASVSDGQNDSLAPEMKNFEAQTGEKSDENSQPPSSDQINLPFECSACDLMFSTKCQVLYHCEEDHTDNKFPSCGFCSKFFVDKKNLEEHMSIHSGSKNFMCEVCCKYFRTKQCLRQHQFIHAEVKPFICSYCGHGFTQRGFFEEHVRRHTGVKPFKCAICAKAFVSKNLLKVHMYSHTGLRPHKCNLCPKSFAENYQLVTHMRTHNQERPFQCSICDKAFYVKSKVMRHLHTVHNVDKEVLTNFVPTRVGEGTGYRDRTKLKNYQPEPPPRKTQVVYIDAKGNIVSQMMKTDEEIKKEKEEARIRKQHTEKQIKPQPSPFVFIKPNDQLAVNEGSSQTDATESFEVFTRRDASGQIQVETILPTSEHVVIETSNAGDTIVSIPESKDGIGYEEFQPIENDGSMELGQNYTFVTQGEQQVQEGHLELITQALQAQSDTDPGQIQVITEQISGDNGHNTEDGNIEIYTEMETEQVENNTSDGTENFSINIGEDGTVDPADFEKIEALRNLYSDQQIVIVLEQEQQ